ncbi:MAG: bifunctional hydroxymethylpyrimidine kinase/phosphomethylpyrimidine kinase [Steroidobacteraceae bacterium]
MRRPAVLVIAGSDSSGGAGLARDLRTLADFGADALCVVTAVTAQSDRRVLAVHHVPPALIRAQLEAALETQGPSAVKLGMLGTRATVEVVADGLRAHEAVPWVLDPVMVASSGGALLDAEGRAAMKERLLPRATLVTPNIPEAAALLDEGPAASEASSADDARATDGGRDADEATLTAWARRILALGPRAVLLKGGHARGGEAVDWLVSRDRSPERIASPRIEAVQRGTGCALASAIAAQLASGLPLDEACRRAKTYVVDLLRAAARDG